MDIHDDGGHSARAFFSASSKALWICKGAV